MMSSPHSHLPYGPDGLGVYSKYNLGTKVVISQVIGPVLEAIDGIPFSKNEGVFTICDYGAADGGASLQLLAPCIKSIKDTYGEDQEIHIIYEDQPVNDFKSLFMRIHGLIQGPPSYLEQFNNVYVSASGTSFYSQVVPSNTVHLGFSSFAVHWLSKRPGHLDGNMTHILSSHSTQKQLFAEQAARDWETILLKRAAELKKGGRMYIASLCVDALNRSTSCHNSGLKSIRQHLGEIWEELKTEGIISEEEHKSMGENSYFRTEAEFRAPFVDGSPAHKAGLRLASYEEKERLCPMNRAWVNTDDKGSADAAREYAEAYVRSVRTWSNSTFMTALAESRPQTERDVIVDELYRRCEDRVAADPSQHIYNLYYACLLIEKL